MLNLIISHWLKTSVHRRHLWWDTTIWSKQKSSGLSRLNYAISAQFCLRSRYYYANGISLRWRSLNGGLRNTVTRELVSTPCILDGLIRLASPRACPDFQRSGVWCPCSCLSGYSSVLASIDNSWRNPSFQVVWKPENKWRRSWYSGLVGVAT